MFLSPLLGDAGPVGGHAWVGADPRSYEVTPAGPLRPAGGNSRESYVGSTSSESMSQPAERDQGWHSSLVYSWRWRGGPFDGENSIVEVSFASIGAESVVTVHHRNLVSATAEEEHQKGWTSVLPSLAEHLSAGTANIVSKEWDMSAFTVVARATAKPGRENQLADSLLASVRPTHDEPGCLRFSLFRSVDNPGVITAIEQWASREDWQMHMQTPHIQRVLQETSDIMAGPPELDVLEQLPAGEQTKEF
jgi:quinol monooxygenase YgiN